MSATTIKEAERTPQAYTIAEFCRLFAISRSQFYREHGAGRISIRKAGTRSLISREDAERWFSTLPVSSAKAA